MPDGGAMATTDQRGLPTHPTNPVHGPPDHRDRLSRVRSLPRVDTTCAHGHHGVKDESAMGRTPPPPPQKGRTDEEAIAILRRIEKDSKQNDQSKKYIKTAALSAVRSFATRLLFSLAGLILIGNGIEGMGVRSESPSSLFAIGINRNGTQSLGLGIAMFAFALAPYPMQSD